MTTATKSANTSGTKKATNVAVATTAAPDASLPQFPRVMKLVNDTAQPWVIGGVHAAPSSSTTYTERDADSLARHRADCEYILSVSDHYKPVEPKKGEEAAPNALRIVEVADEPAADSKEADGTA